VRRRAAALRRIPTLLLALGLAAALATPPAAAEGELELKVKAAFLFNFVKFVSWPPQRSPAEGQPYQLCMVNAEALAGVLGEAVRDKQVEGHALQVRVLRAGETQAGCHIVYAAGSDPATAEALLHDSAGQGVLTVHEARSAVSSGVVRFFLEDRRMRFEVNTSAAEQQHLQLSSRLLSVATRL